MSNDIEMFWHCKNCSGDMPPETSPKLWSRLEAGWTVKGMQVRCIRCDMNIMNIDLRGQKVSTS